jgi:uncharacterized protein (TIGR02453 family)
MKVFSEKTLKFIKKASRQKRADWLERNRSDYEAYLLEPLQNLALHLKTELASEATGYHFPQKGIGRIKRPAHRAEEWGVFKDWISYAAARPRVSRFDHNPNLFFMIHPDDAKEGILVAGGLYMPSSRQLRSIREAIAQDASAFDRLFAKKDFSRCFKGGFSDEKISTRCPRGFEPNHPRMNWLKLQAYFVWRPYSKKEFKSSEFASLVARDWRQILHLNELLDQAIEGRLPKRVAKTKAPKLLDRLANLSLPELSQDSRRKMDF